MKKEQREVRFHGTREEVDGCVLDFEMPCTKFYSALFHDILDGKFTKVNSELY